MPEEDQVKPEDPVRAGKSSASPLLGELKNWVRDIIFAALTAVLIVVFVIQPVKVEGTSMEPRLFDQERIFVNKFVYRIADIHREDIVVFWYPKDPTKSFIKRVIGLPGEEVLIRDGIVYINGEPLDEPYVPKQFFDPSSFGPVIVPANSYFVLGDHRNSSNDSRSWGFVPYQSIFGKAVLRYWPIAKFGLIE